MKFSFHNDKIVLMYAMVNTLINLPFPHIKKRKMLFKISLIPFFIYYVCQVINITHLAGVAPDRTRRLFKSSQLKATAQFSVSNCMLGIFLMILSLSAAVKSSPYIRKKSWARNRDVSRCGLPFSIPEITSFLPESNILLAIFKRSTEDLEGLYHNIVNLKNVITS